MSEERIYWKLKILDTDPPNLGWITFVMSSVPEEEVGYYSCCPHSGLPSEEEAAQLPFGEKHTVKYIKGYKGAHQSEDINPHESNQRTTS